MVLRAIAFGWAVLCALSPDATVRVVGAVAELVVAVIEVAVAGMTAACAATASVTGVV